MSGYFGEQRLPQKPIVLSLPRRLVCKQDVGFKKLLRNFEGQIRRSYSLGFGDDLRSEPVCRTFMCCQQVGFGLRFDQFSRSSTRGVSNLLI